MHTIHAISALAFMDEAASVKALLGQVEALPIPQEKVMTQASEWTQAIRTRSMGHGVEAFLAAYSLNTTEGVALIGLAEALLRIPDATTADALIRDTFEGRHWEDFSGTGSSWLFSLSRWGLQLTGKVVDYGQDAQRGVLHVIKGLVSKLGEPVIREALKKAMQLVGSQFVLGETVKDALRHSSPYLARGYRFSYDILGEGARSDEQARAYVKAYHEGIELIAKAKPSGAGLWESPSMSVKLSALHPRYQWTQRERVLRELLPRLAEIMLHAREAGIAISIDAEEATRLDVEMLVFEHLLEMQQLQGWNGAGFVVQAYQKRAPYVIGWLAGLAQLHKRIIPVRLVKGAYWDSEIKTAQVGGLEGYPVFTRKEYTDLSYLACAAKLLAQPGCFYPQFATHNAHTLASVIRLAEAKGWQRGGYEIQRLHGMGEALHDMALEHAPSRIYAPIGPHKDLLAYLIRRLLENGANSSFVHQVMDEHATQADILRNPVTAAQESLSQSPSIPLPSALYGTERRNSAGIDFGNAVQLQALQEKIAQHATEQIQVIADHTLPEVNALLDNAVAASSSWREKGVEQRALILEKAADLLEKHGPELIALCALEGKKTLVDGVAEVREAADFCRYYAAQARCLFARQSLAGPSGESNLLSLHPRGVFACISPWNFPLAIFIGQVAAALVTGNTVIAKPAEQTPLVALRATQLMHEAGVPPHVLQLAFGEGAMVGAALVRDARINGVVFTGGTDTAQAIALTLAQRKGPIIPLIAETGGLNCMVVDSSALIERAVDDIILSAFGSAGQRCSALRVLFVQEDIADDLLNLLAGAMQELVLGSPLDPATDISSVIGRDAAQRLHQHIEQMKQTAHLIAFSPAPKGECLIVPHVFELNSINELTGEVFGPILHVIRFRAGTLAQVADAINSTGYGLTFGIHSRVDEHIRLLVERVRAGNIYINRSMIGATVGVQPFGGEGLSGTGPKAGGPHYLLQFVTERTLTTNIAAIGGNIALLTGR